MPRSNENEVSTARPKLAPAERAARVRGLQESLNAAGAKIAVDGVLGTETVNAVHQTASAQLTGKSNLELSAVARSGRQLDVRANLLTGAKSTNDISEPIRNTRNINQGSQQVPFLWSIKGRQWVHSAVWQVARLPFPGDYKTWQVAPGLIASGQINQLPDELTPWMAITDSETLNVRGSNWASFTIDFAPIVNSLHPTRKVVTIRGNGTTGGRPPVVPDDTQPPSPPTIGGRLPVAPPGSHPTPSPSSQQPNGRPPMVPPGTQPPPSPPPSPEQPSSSKPIILRPSTRTDEGVYEKYYVRLVLLDEHGQCIGFSAPATIHTNPPGDPVSWHKGAPIIPGPPKRNAIHPNVRIVGFKPWRASLFHNNFIYTRDDPLGFYHAGDKVPIPSGGSESIWDEIVDVVSDVVGFIAGAVNWVSNAYHDIKAGVISAAASVLKTLPGCPDQIDVLLSMAVDVGLAALGLPPDIPNFDQLMAQGQGYLVGCIADEVGVPGSEIALNQMISGMASQVRAAYLDAGGTGSLYAPDPDFLEQPLKLLLVVSNPAQYSTDPVSIFTTNSASEFPAWYRPPFGSIWTRVPSLLPGTTMTVPICMERAIIEFPFGTSPTLEVPSNEEYWVQRRDTYGPRFGVNTTVLDPLRVSSESSYKAQDSYHAQQWEEWNAA